jgi:hypothetical protein
MTCTSLSYKHNWEPQEIKKGQKTEDKHAESWGQVGWCSDGDTQQPGPPPVSLLYTVGNNEVDQQFWGGG